MLTRMEQCPGHGLLRPEPTSHRASARPGRGLLQRSPVFAAPGGHFANLPKVRDTQQCLAGCPGQSSNTLSLRLPTAPGMWHARDPLPCSGQGEPYVWATAGREGRGATLSSRLLNLGALSFGTGGKKCLHGLAFVSNYSSVLARHCSLLM